MRSSLAIDALFPLSSSLQSSKTKTKENVDPRDVHNTPVLCVEVRTIDRGHLQGAAMLGTPVLAVALAAVHRTAQTGRRPTACAAPHPCARAAAESTAADSREPEVGALRCH